MQAEILSPRSGALASFTQDVQEEIKGMRQSVFFRWPTPPVPPEGKAEWDEDLAILWATYGAAVMLDALTWFRQNVTKRPAIPEIRERCRIIREAKAPRGKGSDPRAFEPFGSQESYERAIREHLANPNDNRFVRIEQLERDVAEFNSLKQGARAKGERVPRSDVRDWWLWRTEATDQEWAAIRAAQRKAPGRVIDYDNMLLTEILRDIA